MMKRILITGGAGFIGRALATRLAQAGHTVFVADHLHPQVHPNGRLPDDFPQDVTFIPFDVTETGSWRALLGFAKADAIVHLAAETGTGQSLTAAARHARVNVLGTAQLTDALTQCAVRPSKIIIASSRAVYGDGAWQDSRGRMFYPGGRTAAQLAQKRWDHVGPDGLAAAPLPHRAGVTEARPVSVYGATKLTQELILQAWCDAFACQLTVLRLQNVYGPGQALRNAYTGILSLFAQRALKKLPIEVFEDGHMMRDFVFIDDVVQSMLLALESPLPGAHTFDIGSGECVSILAVAQILARMCEAPTPTVTGFCRHGDVRSASCSIEAASNALRYSPSVRIDQGLKSLLHWVAAQPPQDKGMSDAC